MSLFVTVATDLLVAVLLAATIVTSLRLSKRIGQLKGDEAALRSTIGDLMVATNNAERAIIGLRNALDECDRNLADRIQSAQACTTTLAGGVEAGEAVLTRIAAIMGAGGLGRLVYKALQNFDIAASASSGLALFLVAVVLDRLSQPEESDGGVLLVQHHRSPHQGPRLAGDCSPRRFAGLVRHWRT